MPATERMTELHNVKRGTAVNSIWLQVLEKVTGKRQPPGRRGERDRAGFH